MKSIRHYAPNGNGIVFRFSGYLIEEAREMVDKTGIHMRGGPKQVTSGDVEIAVSEKPTATIAGTIKLLGATPL